MLTGLKARGFRSELIDKMHNIGFYLFGEETNPDKDKIKLEFKEVGGEAILTTEIPEAEDA